MAIFEVTLNLDGRLVEVEADWYGRRGAYTDFCRVGPDRETILVVLRLRTDEIGAVARRD